MLNTIEICNFLIEGIFDNPREAYKLCEEGKFKDAKFKLLLTLGKEPMKSDLKIIKGEIKKYAAVHINLTFKDLLENIGKQIDERDKDILEVFEDFKLYCVEAGLIPEEYLMGAVLTNNTIKDNKVYNLYYHPYLHLDNNISYWDPPT